MAADAEQMQTGSEYEPPYDSVLAAMRDGWRVFQASRCRNASAATGTGQLANEFWLGAQRQRRGVVVTGAA